MTHIRRKVVGVAFVLILALPGLALSEDSNEMVDSSPGERLDVTPIRDLLHLINTIVDQNPDYETTLARLEHLEGRQLRDSLAPYIQHNTDNPRIAGEIDSLLNSPAYKLYYGQFGRNAKPESHRAFFCSLPYCATNGPGGVGDVLFELCQHREAVAGWYDSVVARIDAGHSIEIAKEWLPPGEYVLPKTYFIYDGMGDGFARDGMICFDLYSLVLRKRSAPGRFENMLDMLDMDVESIERVLVYSDSLIYRAETERLPWAERTRRQLIGELVSEGVAMQCDPRTGLQREVRRDSVVIQYWIRTLNRMLAELSNGSMTEPAFDAWRNGQFELTRKLLTECLQRRYAGHNSDSLIAEHMPGRPDLSHTLGWWMVSEISNDGANREKVIRLLSCPDSLASWYNAAIGSEDKSLLADESVW
jgi:hypothetical protein